MDTSHDDEIELIAETLDAWGDDEFENVYDEIEFEWEDEIW